MVHAEITLSNGSSTCHMVDAQDFGMADVRVMTIDSNQRKNVKEFALNHKE